MSQIYTRPPISPARERPSPHEQRSMNDSFCVKPLQHTHEYSENYRPPARNSWELHSPMSAPEKAPFEEPVPKAGEMYAKRPESRQNSSREQLPPLSSLFGSSSPHHNRTAPFPYVERRSPVFPAASTLDARYPATPIHPERHHDSSYFQRPGSARPYAYGSRPEPRERLGLPTSPHPVHVGAGAESPRHDSQHGPNERSRPRHPSALSPRLQGSVLEYFGRDASLRPHPEHRPLPPQVPRPEAETRPAYRDSAHSTPATLNYPPTPASTVAGESAAPKDGLGPKIWTGTQFLPRFVRQADVPGEGTCYFYDDGTHCKTVIDGEIVNAHWGVTKAGKPRKRLAIACITCREKKIKCDPDYPRCVQCEKFGRICKFKNAPRGGQGSPGTPPADSDDLIPRPASPTTDPEEFNLEPGENSQSISSRQTLRRVTPDSETHPPKRQRTGYLDFTPVASEASPRPGVREPSSPSHSWVRDLVRGPINHSVLQDLQVNPYTAEPTLVTELMTVFFQHVPEVASCMFPAEAFTAWVQSRSEKSLDDLMLIYSLLALATVFSSQPEHKTVGTQYASIARYACDNRHFTLQLVQSRLALALYYFAINNANDSWDTCGGAIRAASALRLNIEFEKSDDAYLKTLPYGLNRPGFAECRRRTFWSCYLLDRFNGFCSGHFNVIHPADVFLRLPCDANSFESQMEVHNPYFDPSATSNQGSPETVGAMAYLINICTIWGEVMANVYRTSHRPVPAASNAAFLTFYERTTQKLHAWEDSLPAGYQFSAENLMRARDPGQVRTLTLMHSVYHTTAMKLNRYLQLTTLTASQVAQHVSVARQHAERLLSVVDTLAARRGSLPRLGDRDAAADKFSSPFVGYAIVSAVDILTARVSVATLARRLDSFHGAQAILAELALFWQCARTQQALLLQRIRELADLGARGEAGLVSRGGRGIRDGILALNEPMERTFSRDYDSVYA